MHTDPIVFTIFVIFAGSALVATIALFARQALLVAYILLGVLLGPSALGVVGDPALVREISHIGIMFLLFLMGLELNPKDLLSLIGRTSAVTLISSLSFAAVGIAVGLLFGFSVTDSLLIGAAAMFSSTILGLKLLPTTVLHHQRIGTIVISILLLQDVIAILLLLILEGGGTDHPAITILRLAASLPLLIIAAFLFVRYVLLRLLQRFDKIREYIFLVSIGWCLGIAEAATLLGMSGEIGAFIAGVSLAANPVSLYVAESLKPLRDFFLVLFFFSLGAGFDLAVLPDVLLPALVLVALMLLLKPVVFRLLLQCTGEQTTHAREIGVRLGQLSEFSLLIAVLALNRGEIGFQASSLIQLATLLGFLVSVYSVILRYPSPIALSDELRRD